MKLSRSGLRLIAEFEGFVDHAYKPVSTERYWTIGYGHYGPDVKAGATITKRRARRLLREDTQEAAAAVRELIDVALTQGQFDALVSFTFNLGYGSLQSSTLRKRLNAGEHRCLVIQQEFPKWVMAGGQRLDGLVLRRTAEIRHACG